MPKQTLSRQARAEIARHTGISRTRMPGPWKAFDSSRVAQGRYDSEAREIQVYFRDGTPWVYQDVPQSVWRNMRRSASPGRYVNRILNSFPYSAHEDWEEYDEKLQLQMAGEGEDV